MVTVTVEQVPSDALDAKLAGWAERFLTVSAAFGAIVEDFRGMEKRRFNAEGPGWQPLAATTVAQRERLGYGGPHPILRRTGLLSDSLTGQADHSVVRATPTELFVGTDVPYAHWHQNGGTTDGRPPQRVIVHVDEADKARWMAILGRWVAGDLVMSSDAGPGGM